MSLWEPNFSPWSKEIYKQCGRGKKEPCGVELISVEGKNINSIFLEIFPRSDH